MRGANRDDLATVPSLGSARIEPGQRRDEGLELIPERVEVDLVGRLDVGEGRAQQGAAGWREAQFTDAAVGVIGVALEQSARLELTSHLTGHHRVDPRVRG